MEGTKRPAVLCISTYEKGQAFLRELAAQGIDVVLLTVDKLRDADWPKESLAKLVTMPEELSADQILNTICYEARTWKFSRVVALDEFDLETAAVVREHMRLPGMSQSETRFFRDKLAMRVQARACGVAVPEFSGVFHYDDLRAYLSEVPGAWLLKPRTNASAIGIRKLQVPDDLWRALDELGDLQSHYVLERFVPGDIFHVEGVTWKGDVVFAAPFQYGAPPMKTMHEGGVFSTRSLDPTSDDAKGLLATHAAVLKGLGMKNGVTHTEFIKSYADGRFYFLETAARVGGAYIAEVVSFANGVNPWVEWARIEAAALHGEEYRLPKLKEDFAGSIICLARQDEPETSAFSDPEVVMRLHKHHHAGLIVRSASVKRVEQLVEEYSRRFVEDFLAIEPVPDKPTA